MENDLKNFLKKYHIEYVIAAFISVLFIQISYMFFKSKIINFLKDFLFWYNLTLILLSFFVFLIARISYPKIYKFKILLTGYILIGHYIIFLLITNKLPFKLQIFGINFDFYQKALEAPGHFALAFLITLFNFNLIFVTSAKPTINYDDGKKYSLFVLLINIIFYLYILFFISGKFIGSKPEIFATKFVLTFNKYYQVINFLVLIIVFLLSIYNIEEEHNYGSIIMAMSIMCFFCALNADTYWPVKITLPIMAIIIIAGMFAHWVNCLHHKAHYDPLLKIYNRQYMNNIINGIAEIKLGKIFSVLMCDIDHFKKINDTYGHEVGDIVLYNIAQTIRNSALPEGITCRYGGEEIIVFLREKIDDEAESKAEKIRKTVKKLKIKTKGKTISVTVSIGGAGTDKGMSDIGKIIKKADENVYKAKKRGRDRVVWE